MGLPADGRETHAWLVRGGWEGERERRALDEGMIFAGWHEVGDLSGVHSWEELTDRLQRTFPDKARNLIGNWTGQLWKLTNAIREGDLVVMPLKTSQARVAIGRVSGPYAYRAEEPPDFRQTRKVTWIRTDLPRDEIKADLRASMSSLLTVCKLSRNDAVRRIAHLAEHGTDPGYGGEEEVTDSEKLLEDAVSRDADNPRTLTIRNLLLHWGDERRTNAVIAKIKADLADKGLTTRPPFTEGAVSDEVAIVPLGGEPGTAAESVGDAEDTEDTENVTAEPSMALRLGSLRKPVKPVRSTATLTQAKTIMLRYRYSQLAVLDEDNTYRGAVSWESIGRASIAVREPSLADATVRAHVVDHDAFLLDQISAIFENGFIFVWDADHKQVGGIFTAADLTEQFGSVARPFVLIEEAENRLRRAADVFTVDELRADIDGRQKARVHRASDLTFGNYYYVLRDPTRWAKLGWKIDRELFCELLEDVGKVRNELMHFSSDQLSDEQYASIEGLLGLLRTVDPRA